MKCGFSQILVSCKKSRGFELVILLMLLILGSTSFVSCTVHNDPEVEPDSILVQPAYHLAIYRSEFAHLFYETDEHIGFQIADGIFLYNYKQDRMEAAFALREGSFELDYAVVPTMSADEKNIIINGFNPSESTMSTHFYQYDIASGEISRIEGSAMEVARYPHPPEGRLFEALQSETWMFEDIRYYPEGSSTSYAPFNKFDIPTVTYELQDTDLDIPIAPYLTLTSDGRFVFTYSSHNNYVNYGEYEFTGTEYKMLTEDGKHTFRFHKQGDNLLFDADHSARCKLDDGTELTNGATFTLIPEDELESEKGSVSTVGEVDGPQEVHITEWNPTPYETINNFENVTMTVREGTVSSTELTLTFSNNSNSQCTFGLYFSLEKMSDGRWYQVPVNIDPNYGFNDDLIQTLPPNGGVVELVDWEWLYGSLGTGKYRIVKTVNVFREEISKGDADTFHFSAEFVID